MSRWLSLARRPEEISKTLPDTPTKPDKREVEGATRNFCPVLSGCRVRKSRKVDAARSSVITVPNSTSLLKTASPDSLGGNGYQRTWTGAVVSLADWEALSEWERHGPNGRMFYADTWHWQYPHEREGHDA